MSVHPSIYIIIFIPWFVQHDDDYCKTHLGVLVDRGNLLICKLSLSTINKCFAFFNGSFTLHNRSWTNFILNIFLRFLTILRVLVDLNENTFLDNTTISINANLFINRLHLSEKRFVWRQLTMKFLIAWHRPLQCHCQSNKHFAVFSVLSRLSSQLPTKCESSAYKCDGIHKIHII